MPIITVDTDFIIDQKDEEWTAEEIEMLENLSDDDYRSTLPRELLLKVAEQLKQGNDNAWKSLYAQDKR